MIYSNISQVQENANKYNVGKVFFQQEKTKNI